jgi:hypothetical protein
VQNTSNILMLPEHAERRAYYPEVYFLPFPLISFFLPELHPKASFFTPTSSWHELCQLKNSIPGCGISLPMSKNTAKANQSTSRSWPWLVLILTPHDVPSAGCWQFYLRHLNGISPCILLPPVIPCIPIPISTPSPPPPPPLFALCI